MKKILLAAFISLALFSCTDKKKQEKTAMDEVITIHDKVMGENGQLMKNKMKLDTLSQQHLSNVKDTTAEKAKIKALLTKLTNAEDAMEDWMHKFEPDNTGKSHTEIMDYMRAQKTQISQIYSQIHAAIDSSNNYLIQLKK